MTFRSNTLRDAICLALAGGTLATGAAVAQESATTQQATTLDRIEVTGTRIRQVDVETAQPVTFITRQDIERQGFQSVADILQNISATGTPPISRASPLSAGELAGGTYISLRNLGAQRTLVLLNGRRLGISTSGFADISTIPAAAVERIEVLKDGASSIYGSDAIAGVINIITRTNFEGARASAYFGQYSEGDGDITNGDFVIGFTGDRGSLTVAAEWREEDVVKASSRPYSAFPRSSRHPTDNWTTVSQWGGFQVTAAAPLGTFAPGTFVTLRRGGDPRNPGDYVAQNRFLGSCANSTEAAGCTPGSTLDKSNTNEQTDLRTPIEAKGLYVDGTFQIADWVNFRTNLLFNERTSSRTVAGFPLQASSPSTGGPATLAANSYFNPIGVPISTWFRRTWEIPRVTDSELTTYRFSGAFEGSFEFAERTFDWDISYLRNDNRQVQQTFGNINLNRLRQAVGPSFLNASGQVQCGTAAAPIPLSQCVPFNPFLPFGRVGPGGLTNNTALRNFLFQTEQAVGETDTTVIAANLAGSIVELPAGPLGFAFGLENRKERGAFTPDALSVTGASTNLAAGPTRGGYSVDEAYLELEIPILSDIFLARELSLNIASRYSDFDTFGETTNNKFSLKWKPIDSLLLRATAADGFRAPTIADLFGGGSQTFSFYSDPCDVLLGLSQPGTSVRQNCQRDLGALAATYRQQGQAGPVTSQPAQTPIAFTSGSNPLLTPELSKSQTIGAVWSPTFLEGLNIALDWWKIRIDDTIVADSPSNILFDCYVNNITSRCSSALFTRDPVTGVPLVTFGGNNAGFRKVEGFDFDIAYRWQTENYGNFSVVSNSTYTSRDYFVSTDAPVIPISSVGVTSQFRIRSNLNLNWQKDSFGVTWTSRYFSSMQEGCTYFLGTATGANSFVPGLECNRADRIAPNGNVPGPGVTSSQRLPRNRVGSNTFNDVQVRWEAPWNATIAVGANNVFDKVGPTMYSQPSANVSYYGGFDIGRFLYMRYTQRF